MTTSSSELLTTHGRAADTIESGMFVYTTEWESAGELTPVLSIISYDPASGSHVSTVCAEEATEYDGDECEEGEPRRLHLQVANCGELDLLPTDMLPVWEATSDAAVALKDEMLAWWSRWVKTVYTKDGSDPEARAHGELSAYRAADKLRALACVQMDLPLPAPEDFFAWTGDDDLDDEGLDD